MKNKKIHDIINKPSWYNNHPSGYECIDIVQHYDFCIGNVIKYVWRAGLKDPNIKKEIEDLEKARYYLEKKITLLKKSLGDIDAKN